MGNKTIAAFVKKKNKQLLGILRSGASEQLVLHWPENSYETGAASCSIPLRTIKSFTSLLFTLLRKNNFRSLELILGFEGIISSDAEVRTFWSGNVKFSALFIVLSGSRYKKFTFMSTLWCKWAQLVKSCD